MNFLTINGQDIMNIVNEYKEQLERMERIEKRKVKINYKLCMGEIRLKGLIKDIENKEETLESIEHYLEGYKTYINSGGSFNEFIENKIDDGEMDYFIDNYEDRIRDEMGLEENEELDGDERRVRELFEDYLEEDWEEYEDDRNVIIGILNKYYGLNMEDYEEIMEDFENYVMNNY